MSDTELEDCQAEADSREWSYQERLDQSQV